MDWTGLLFLRRANLCDVSFHCFLSTHTSSISCKEDCEYYSENGHEGEIALVSLDIEASQQKWDQISKI